jgi:hypothetical protein
MLPEVIGRCCEYCEDYEAQEIWSRESRGYLFQGKALAVMFSVSVEMREIPVCCAVPVAVQSHWISQQWQSPERLQERLVRT